MSETKHSPLPWSLETGTDPGCARCSSEGVRGSQVLDAKGGTVFNSGHDTFMMNEDDDLALIVTAVNQYATSQQLIAELVEALAPFAALDVEAFEHNRDKDDSRVVYQMNDKVITLGHFRAAQAAISKARGGQ